MSNAKSIAGQGSQLLSSSRIQEICKRRRFPCRMKSRWKVNCRKNNIDLPFVDFLKQQVQPYDSNQGGANGRRSITEVLPAVLLSQLAQSLSVLSSRPQAIWHKGEKGGFYMPKRQSNRKKPSSNNWQENPNYIFYSLLAGQSEKSSLDVSQRQRKGKAARITYRVVSKAIGLNTRNF